MRLLNNRDLLAGICLTALGVFVFFYAISNYEMGSWRQMGPGRFPATLGVILAILGGTLSLQSLRQGQPIGHFPIRPFLFVLMGTASFGVLVTTFGLFPAIASVLVISVFADTDVRPFSLVGLVAFMWLVSILVFKTGLGLTIPIFDVPW